MSRTVGIACSGARRTRTLLLPVLLLLSVLGLAACGSSGRSIAGASSHSSGTTAQSLGTSSSGAITSFIARAQRGLNGTFAATYEVNAPFRSRAARLAHVVVARLANSRIFYRQTPALSGDGMGQVKRTPHSFEVFERPNSDYLGIFSCTQAEVSSPWACVGPYTGIGMGGMEALMDPYPPQALELGLENASAAYTGKMATDPEPTRLLWRQLDSHRVQCIDFGETARLLGSVCLNQQGLVASYDLPQSVTYSTYQTAELRNYSAHVNVDTFTLPAKPTALAAS
jgi:hypothetical protein